MKNLIILSKRSYETWPSYDLIYEWENQIASFMRLKSDKKYDRINNSKIIPNFVKKYIQNKNLALYFEMSPNIDYNNKNQSNYIPWIVDFFLKKEQLNLFYQQYKHCPLVIISSKEAFEFLKSNNCPLNYIHIPLSISDKYTIHPLTKFKKKYDLVLVGRQNPILQGFVEQYAKENRNFYYVYRKLEGNKFLYYTSKGEFIGDINTREKYINLLKQAKCGLYSTPGIDGGEIRTNGFNQVTPRFLELLACGCHIIARYQRNQDTDFYCLNKFSENIKSYDEFRLQMDFGINNQVDMKFYSEYLKAHYTSQRIIDLKEILKKL